MLDITEYQEFKTATARLEKARQNLEEKQKKADQAKITATELNTSLGIDKDDQKVDFGKIQSAELESRVLIRKADLAGQKVEESKQNLLSTIEKIKNDRAALARAEGLKINKEVLQAIETIERSKKKYTELNGEIRKNFDFRSKPTSKTLLLESAIREIIGPTPVNNEILCVKSYPTEAFINSSKKYQEGAKKLISLKT